MTHPTTIPSRFRRSAFDRYAAVIGQIVRFYPRNVSLDPKPLSPDTFASGLRNAIRAKQEHGYMSPLVDEMLFLQCSKDVVVRLLPNGRIEAGGQAKNDSITFEQSKENNCVVRYTSSIEGLVEVCKILSQRCFEPPLQVTATLTSLEVARLEQHGGDIAIIPCENKQGEYIII